MVGQFIYLQDSLLKGVFLLSIAPEFIRGYLSHKIETHPLPNRKVQTRVVRHCDDIAGPDDSPRHP